MSELKGKSVQVTSPIEYGIALASFMIAGANIWPWHKGYKPLDEEDTHHTYAWEDCGFLKMAGVFESMRGDYKSPMELIDVIRNQLTTITNQRDELLKCLETVNSHAVYRAGTFNNGETVAQYAARVISTIKEQKNDN